MSFTVPRGFLFGFLLLALILVVLSIGTDASEADGPMLVVDSPEEGFITRATRLPVTGVTEPDTEVVVLAKRRSDEYWNNTTSAHDGSFEVWTHLSYGPQKVIVMAGASGNSTTVILNVTLDLNRPRLEVWIDFENEIPVPFNETMDGYIVQEREVFLNGTVVDYESRDSDIVIRINGEELHHLGDGEIHAPLMLEEGLNTFAIDATDVVGNRATVFLYIVRDTTPPLVRIQTPADWLVTNISAQTVTGLTEPHTTVFIRLKGQDDDRNLTITSGGDGTFWIPVNLMEGTQTLTVTAVDYVGNMNTSMRTLILDTQAPEFVIDRPQGGRGVINYYTYVIGGTIVSEDMVDVWIGGEEVRHTGVFQLLVLLEDGDNSITVRVVDGAGNERVETVFIVVDTFDPTLHVTSPQYTNVLTNDTTLLFEGRVRGAIGVEVDHRWGTDEAQLVSGTWEDGEWRYVLEMADDNGERDVKVYAYDEAGNRVTTVIHVTVDVEPPSLYIDGRPVRATNVATATISGTTDAEVVTVNGNDQLVTDGVFVLKVDLENTENHFVLTVRDMAGNVAQGTVDITWDPVPPSLKLEHSEVNSEGMVEVTGTTDEDVVYVYVDGDSYFVDNGTFTFLIELEGEGRHEINFTVEDAAGNRETKFIKVDSGQDSPGFGAMAALAVVAMAAEVARRRR
jgi:hypothetical protein